MQRIAGGIAAPPPAVGAQFPPLAPGGLRRTTLHAHASVGAADMGGGAVWELIRAGHGAWDPCDALAARLGYLPGRVARQGLRQALVAAADTGPAQLRHLVLGVL